TWVEGTTLRLDDCELISPRKKEVERLTADYLPHFPGRVLVYDMVTFPPYSRTRSPLLVRQVFREQAGGKTEGLTRHRAGLVIKSLLDDADHKRWLALLPSRKVLLPAPATQRRLAGGSIEVGEQAVRFRDGGLRRVTLWRPALKVGAAPGDTWK